MKTQDPTRPGHPFQPGDKVSIRLRKGENFAYRGDRDTGEVKSDKIYTVRETAVHPVSGRYVLWLVGIYGHQNKYFDEAPFNASDFKSVWSSREAPLPPVNALIEIPVKVTKAIAAEIQSAALYPNVENLFASPGEDWLERVCHRWSNRISNLGMHASLAQYHALFARDLELEDGESITVPLSPLAYQNALEICEHLGINLETWLQSILVHFATKREKRREENARIALRNERRDAVKAKRDAMRREKEEKQQRKND
jgi:hypothetical protein